MHSMAILSFGLRCTDESNGRITFGVNCICKNSWNEQDFNHIAMQDPRKWVLLSTFLNWDSCTFKSELFVRMLVGIFEY